MTQYCQFLYAWSWLPFRLRVWKVYVRECRTYKYQDHSPHICTEKWASLARKYHRSQNKVATPIHPECNWRRNLAGNLWPLRVAHRCRIDTVGSGTDGPIMRNVWRNQGGSSGTPCGDRAEFAGLCIRRYKSDTAEFSPLDVLSSRPPSRSWDLIKIKSTLSYSSI